MKAKLIPSLLALTLTTFAGAAAHADGDQATLAWQEPGYVMEVVIATAPRVKLASEPTDYVGEVVVVTASRSEVLAARRELFAAAAANWRNARLDHPHDARRLPLMGIPAN
jgi:hypothetical protein